VFSSVLLVSSILLYTAAEIVLALHFKFDTFLICTLQFHYCSNATYATYQGLLVIESAVDIGSSFIVTFPCTVVGSSSSAGSSVTSTTTAAASRSGGSSAKHNNTVVTQQASIAVPAAAASSDSRISNKDDNSNNIESINHLQDSSSANCELATGMLNGSIDDLTAVPLPLLPAVNLRVSYITSYNTNITC
jgi:hypothetical protein